MKPIGQVAPRLRAVAGNRWSFLALIVGTIIVFGSILVIAAAEMTKKSDEANEAVIASTVAVPGMPYRIRESVTRLPSGRCATVIERFELWNGRYLKIPEISVHARTEHPCE